MTDDEDSIRDVLTVWSQMFADQAWSEWSQLFTPDGTFTTATGRTFVGRDALGASWGGIEEQDGRHPQVTYVCAPAVIRIAGDTARAASDHVAYVRASADAAWQILTVGRLLHTLVRQHGGWQISDVREWGYFSTPETLAPLPSVVRDG